jgi:hypothetical protein
MMEAIGSSETFVLTRATQHHIPEDGILHLIMFKIQFLPAKDPVYLLKRPACYSLIGKSRRFTVRMRLSHKYPLPAGWRASECWGMRTKYSLSPFNFWRTSHLALCQQSNGSPRILLGREARGTSLLRSRFTYKWNSKCLKSWIKARTTHTHKSICLKCRKRWKFINSIHSGIMSLLNLIFFHVLFC